MTSKSLPKAGTPLSPHRQRGIRHHLVCPTVPLAAPVRELLLPSAAVAIPLAPVPFHAPLTPVAGIKPVTFIPAAITAAARAAAAAGGAAAAAVEPM
jgi:hypothetical protein